MSWGYRSPYWAGCFLDRWCTRTMRSKIGPMKRVARMLRGHRPLILNWFRAKGQLSSGVVEGFNPKAKLTTRKAYGFRTYHGLEVASYHTLGALPRAEALPTNFPEKLSLYLSTSGSRCPVSSRRLRQLGPLVSTSYAARVDPGQVGGSRSPSDLRINELGESLSSNMTSLSEGAEWVKGAGDLWDNRKSVIKLSSNLNPEDCPNESFTRTHRRRLHHSRPASLTAAAPQVHRPSRGVF